MMDKETLMFSILAGLKLIKDRPDEGAKASEDVIEALKEIDQLVWQKADNLEGFVS